MVQAKDIRETRPRFECIGCHEKFFIAYPECATQEEVIGLRLDKWEMPNATIVEKTSTPSLKTEGEEAKQSCPKCHLALISGIEDCPHCGVIPKKYLSLKTASRIQGSERLNVLWKKIIDEYENDELHQDFIKISSKENNLAYASSQYAQLVKLIPHDERATKMIAEIQALVAVSMAHSTQPIRVQSVKSRQPRWLTAIFIIGAMLVAFGFFFPLFRNVTGLGAVLVFLALGFRINLFKF
jgi:hypothetical protein